jgi:hypothetical protein
VKPLERHGAGTARQPDAVHDLGDRADVGKFGFVSGNEQDSILLAGVERDIERDSMEFHVVVELNNNKGSRNKF